MIGRARVQCAGRASADLLPPTARRRVSPQPSAPPGPRAGPLPDRGSFARESALPRQPARPHTI